MAAAQNFFSAATCYILSGGVGSPADGMNPLPTKACVFLRVRIASVVCFGVRMLMICSGLCLELCSIV